MEGEVINTSDPRAGYLAHRKEIDSAIRRVLEGPAYVLGDAVSSFEKEFAQYVGTGHGVGVNNGTDAIHLALRALDIGVGDEVITVSHTAVATVAAIEMAGATPVLVDVDRKTRTMDPLAAEELISDRTKAILAVHLYGHPVDVPALMELCERKGLQLIEDCAQAHGARWKGRLIGSFGTLSTFSFYPTKNLGAIGDAGMVLANDPELARKLRLLRQYGWETPQYSTIPGWNSRMDPIQAAILSVKLAHLESETQRRRALAKEYNREFEGLPMTLPVEKEGSTHVYHLYVVELKDTTTRDALKGHLAEHGVMAGIHYPFAVHQQPAYQGRVRSGRMDTTERLTGTVLSLPLHPGLTEQDQSRVVKSVRSFFGS